VRGIVNAKDLVRAATGQTIVKPLGELLHEPLFVPRTTPVKRLFLTFKQKKVHMAIVVSEYGKVLGLVTMDDLLALIFGSLRDERAELQQSMPGIRIQTRTPAPGVPIVDDSSKSDPGDGVPRQRASSEPSGVIAEPVESLDPPPPVHFDEDTPPAIELDELQRARERKS
jgi:CBS domain-containing protein